MTWISGFLALGSLLAVFKAPAKPFWYAALVATEWGHWLAIVSLAVAWVDWRMARRWGISSLLATGAAILYLTPLARAIVVARDLPDQLTARFGSLPLRQEVGVLTRAHPLDFAALFTGIAFSPIRESTLVYAKVNGKSLSLDLFRPLALHPSPAVIIVHSGSWVSGGRDEFQDLSRYLAARGYLVASIDYRLAPGVVFPAQRDDVFTAMAYLKDHAVSLGLDKENIVLLGRSAGGQIALSAAYAQKDPAIRGVIVFYTPNDLKWGHSIPGNPLIMNSQKVIETYLGGTPEQMPGVYEAASPLLSVNDKTPPTLMIHGVRDELVWAQHEERLSKRLDDAKRLYFYLRLPWATHGCDFNFSGPSGQLSTYAIERFLSTVMPVKGGSHVQN